MFRKALLSHFPNLKFIAKKHSSKESDFGHLSESFETLLKQNYFQKFYII